MRRQRRHALAAHDYFTRIDHLYGFLAADCVTALAVDIYICIYASFVCCHTAESEILYCARVFPTVYTRGVKISRLYALCLAEVSVRVPSRYPCDRRLPHPHHFHFFAATMFARALQNFSLPKGPPTV